jgi:uncharacterized protein (TIGR02678 family)
MTDHPQAAAERRVAARHLLANPLTCLEHDEDVFRLIRRHEVELDRWFTQRLGYRLHVAADTARLFKTGFVPEHRPLRTGSRRAFQHLEYVLLTLALATTVAGPTVISLRDLIELIRSSAAEVDISLQFDSTERRALVTALRWMIDHGLASELHSQVDAYAADAAADAVLKMRPDRIALLALPAVADAELAGDLQARTDRRDNTRQWLRARLVEDPVVYRDDLTEAEWTELRRRMGDEERYLSEMFDLVLEGRAEGVAAIDPEGDLADRPFPAGGTEGHAALLLIEELRSCGTDWWPESEVIKSVTRLANEHARHWAKELVAAPERLTRAAVDLLVDVRLAERRQDPASVRLLPAAGRFAPVLTQTSLW